MSNSSNTFFAFLSGALLGAGAALLYAPEKGEETRRRLSEEAGKARVKAKAQWDETSTNLNESTRKILNELEEKLNQSLSSASAKADNLIAATQKRLDELREQNKKLQPQVETPAKKKSTTSSKSDSKSKAKKASTKTKTT